MDWSQILKDIRLENGEIWESYDNNLSLRRKGLGVISDTLESGTNKVSVQVQVYNNVSNQQVLEEALIKASRTSMYDINLDYIKDGPGGLYLRMEPLYSPGQDKRAKSIFNNVFIEVSTVHDNVDVRPIVKYLVDAMSNHLVSTKDIAKVKLNQLYLKREVKVGEEFWVDIELNPKAKLDGYDIGINDAELPHGLEYIESSESKYYLKANEPGAYEFQLLIMDKRTLRVDEVVFSITVKD